MSYEYVLTEDSGPVRIITLNRPSRRNALSLELMLELIDALGDAEAEAGIRAVILAAHGPVFSSGHDLHELAGSEESELSGVFDASTDLMLRIQNTSNPVIAEVHALATAGGCQLVAACDLAIASENASFATPGVQIGLFCTTPGVPLVRAIGRKRAMEMLLTGQPIDAQTAMDWGLVNRVVAADMLRETTLALARTISNGSAHTIALGKRAFYDQVGRDDRSAYAEAKHSMVENAMTADAQEGISAFLERRRAAWQRR